MEPNSWGLTLPLTRNSGSTPDVHFYLGIFPILKFLAEGDCWPLVCWPHEINNMPRRLNNSGSTSKES